jgi:large subunit ribosomal protein L6
MTIAQEDGHLVVTRPSDARDLRALHGLTRSLVNNMIVGVSQGFTKTLELQGVGYRAQQADESVVLQVGFSHTVEVQPLPGVTLRVEGNNRIHVEGNDKQVVGEQAARMRAVRPPNVYTGKGVRYLGEQVRRKAGKAGGRKR